MPITRLTFFLAKFENSSLSVLGFVHVSSVGEEDLSEGINTFAETPDAHLVGEKSKLRSPAWARRRCCFTCRRCSAAIALARFGTWTTWSTWWQKLSLSYASNHLKPFYRPLRRLIITSNLLNDSIIKGLWHVPQELLLLNRLHVGALHLWITCRFFLASSF